MLNKPIAQYELPIDAFIRAIGINRTSPHALFLGSGASISSGVLSAEMCVWQWKKAIYLTNNPEIDANLLDLSLPSVRNRIQEWIAKKGSFPEIGRKEEYGFFAKSAFPISDDRRRYFQNLAAGKVPHTGYQFLPLLAQEGLIRSVWTTNFDGLANKALINSALTTIEVGLDTSHRVYRPPNSDEILCVSLHGDFRYDDLKNTLEEVQSEEKDLIQTLIDTLKHTTLIVSGYSGRDKTVMDALSTGFELKGTGRLYWCAFEEGEPDNSAIDLIEKARGSGRDSYYVSTQGFDDVLERLAFHILTGDNLKQAKGIKENAVEKTNKTFPPFSIEAKRVNSIIKSNAFEITCPNEIIQFEASGFDDKGGWARIRELTKNKPIVAGKLGGKILAFGTIDDIKDVFGSSIKGELSRVPIAEKEMSYEDGVIISLLVEALVKAICLSAELEIDGRKAIKKRKPSSKETINGVDFDVFDAALFSIRSIRGRTYLIIKPTIFGSHHGGGLISKDDDKELKRRVLTKQYNSLFNSALEGWRKILLNSPTPTYEFPPNSGSTFRFVIRQTPIFAKIQEEGTKFSLKIPDHFGQHLKQSGFKFEEPKLLFSNLNGDGYITDTHQLRGIVNNQPYDFSLTKLGLQKEISIGLVCPIKDAPKVSPFINLLHQRVLVDSKKEYILDYPGFSQAFGIPINLPSANDNGWKDCTEPNSGENQRQGASKLAAEITRAIDSLFSSAAPNVVIVFIPLRWKQWESYQSEEEKFDLHDYIKAYCVQRGIASQFIRESTLAKSNKCEVVWWLAQSLYTKSMRTPWVLEALDRTTAFAGLGFSLNFTKGKGQHIILGCSHIYASNGQGLRYQLSKIENPIILRKNPFMSRDDARRVGEGIRQMFFESLQKLPERVVLHKQTPFIQEEKTGLLEGLAGVHSIDLLEINIDSMLRYVASKVRDGKFIGDGFPVKRGTAVIIENQKALIWVHGTAEAVESGKKYYQGKSRIPSPLVIKRHYGGSDFSLLAGEILGLSKMNWNTFDLYTKLPATIASSGAIAQIGNLLERFSPNSYDYRLFF